MMVMERVEGFDLRRLLTPKMYGLTEARVSNNRWLDLNRVVVTAGPEQPRLKAGIAVQIVRECLEALAAIHREGIIHGDIKPANIMLKRTGHSKIIDIGTAFDVSDPPQRRTCTPAYAAPEVLSGSENTARSDLASLGYVTIELLAGRQIFGGISGFSDLMRAKETLPQRLHEVLPEEVSCNSLLMSFLKGLVAPNPKQRFASAEHADLVDQGAAAFHRQLVKSDLASEYENDIRLWIDELFEMDSDGLLQFEIE
jgi:serine/threonine-protein kinase